MSEVSFYPIVPMTKYQNVKNVSFRSSMPINREMEMIPKLLELATNKRGFDRFSLQEMQEMTDIFAQYVSGTYKPDFLKSMLVIGNQKGDLLSFKEIKAILRMTSKLTSVEQNNILGFVKYLKEREYPEYNAEYILKHHTYEKYKGDYDESIPEELIKKAYENVSRRELEIVSSSAHREYLTQKAPKIDKYFADENWSVVRKGVASCNQPEILAEIVLKTGMHTGLSATANYLVAAYNMSEGNMGFVLDLNNCFSKKEMAEILSGLEEKKSVNLINYYPVSVMKNNTNYSLRKISLNVARKEIINKLDLADRIKPREIYNNYVDVMHTGMVYNGNFERGKRR